MAEREAVAAQLVNGMVNAAAEIERWVPGIDAGNAFDLFGLPLFTGLLAGPQSVAAPRATTRSSLRHTSATSNRGTTPTST